MKLNKRFFAVLMAAVMALVFAVPVFAESISGSDILLIAPAPEADSPAVEAAGEGPMIDPSVDANLGDSFTLMGYGMLGIFIVMIIIMIVILVLNVATKPRKNKAK